MTPPDFRRMFSTSAVRLSYGPNGEPVVTIGEGDEARPIPDVYRVQLAHEAGDAVPKLAIWVLQTTEERSPLDVPSAEIVDVRELQRKLRQYAHDVVRAYGFGRALAAHAIQIALLSRDDVPTRVPEMIDNAELMAYGAARTIPDSVGDLLARAWLLADEGERAIAADQAANPIGAADPYPAIVQDMANTLRGIAEAMASYVEYGHGAVTYDNPTEVAIERASAIVEGNMERDE